MDGCPTPVRQRCCGDSGNLATTFGERFFSMTTLKMVPVGPDPLGLGHREAEILELMAAGLSNNGIATTLSVSSKTIEHYIARIFVKLSIADSPDVNRRVQAVIRYLSAA
jgi:DNA-binding NarL/FixJ family response regulator